MGCVVLLPKSFHEFVVRITCGFVFSFTLTPLAGPLLGGIVEANVGARAAERLYDAPAGVGILVGMISYFAAAFILNVARFSKEDVETNRTTIHDIKKRNQPDSGGSWPPSPPSPWPSPRPDPLDPRPRPDTPSDREPDIWSL
jgi:hypothetical protein